MAKKKAAPKSTPAKAKSKKKAKPRTADDVTVELHIPEEVYKQYFPPNMDKDERNKEIRNLFDMVEGQLTKKSMKYCLIKKKSRSKSADAKDDDDRDPIKLCDEGGW